MAPEFIMCKITEKAMLVFFFFLFSWFLLREAESSSLKEVMRDHLHKSPHDIASCLALFLSTCIHRHSMGEVQLITCPMLIRW